MSTSSALSHHYATHAQLIQSDTHAPFEVFENVIDGDRSPLKRAQKYVVKRYFGHMLSPRTALRSARHFLSALLVQPSL